jgi:hypothetical protein
MDIVLEAAKPIINNKIWEKITQIQFVNYCYKHKEKKILELVFKEWIKNPPEKIIIEKLNINLIENLLYPYHYIIHLDIDFIKTILKFICNYNLPLFLYERIYREVNIENRDKDDELKYKLLKEFTEKKAPQDLWLKYNEENIKQMNILQEKINYNKRLIAGKKIVNFVEKWMDDEFEMRPMVNRIALRRFNDLNGEK